MKIRPVRPADLPEWRRLRRLLSPGCPLRRHRLEMAELTRDPARSLVVVGERAPGRLGGYAEAMLREGVDGARAPVTAYLEGWFVEADLRGRGCGRRLLAAVQRWARNRGGRELASDAELGDDDAIAAHRALGFRETFRIVQFLKSIRSRPVRRLSG